jgi:hypothetical protein
MPPPERTTAAPDLGATFDNHVAAEFALKDAPTGREVRIPTVVVVMGFVDGKVAY